MTLSQTITVGNVTHTFKAIVHLAHSPKEFNLNPVKFYLKWGKAIPQGEHFELEIIEPSPEFLKVNKVHITPSKDGKLFMCYPSHLPTLKKTMDIFRVWCLGTVLTIEHGIDLNTVFEECRGDMQLFLSTMKEKYQIVAADESFN